MDMLKQQIRQEQKKKIMNLFQQSGIPNKIFSRLIGIYFWISGFYVIAGRKLEISAVSEWKNFVQNYSIGSVIIWVLLGFAVLTGVYIWNERKLYKLALLDDFVLITGVLFFSVVLMWRNDNFYNCIGVIFIAIVFITYGMQHISIENFEKISVRKAAIITGVLALLVTIWVIVMSISRHKVFVTSCFDMGIFMQMFHSLSTNLSAVTSCERDQFLSHFYVHASYIYYLLVPFFKLFPSANTLLIAQALLAVGGVVPLFLIAKRHGYQGFGLVAICSIYIFYAGRIAPCLYDFHENAFLPTLLLWLLYAIETKNFIMLYTMTILTCLVKEDAPLYVMCIAGYFFFEEKSKKRFHAFIFGGIAAVYFVYITNWLTKYGDGEMMASSRLGSLTTHSDDGFLSIIENILIDPGYFFSLFITEDTLLFFMETLLPLLFLPFFTKKIHRYFFIIPYVIMNLVIGARYNYAAQITYQYIWGPGCFMIYMVLLNCEDLKTKIKNNLIILSAAVCIISSFSLVSFRYMYYERYQDNPEYYDNIDACLRNLPKNGAMAANTYFIPHLFDRDEIYIFDGNDMETNEAGEYTGIKELNRYDILVLSLSDSITEAAIPYLEEAGWQVYCEAENRVIVYTSPDYVPSA